MNDENVTCYSHALKWPLEYGVAAEQQATGTVVCEMAPGSSFCSVS